MALSYRAADDVRELRGAGATAVVIALPWDVIAPHAARARTNHGQSLERLAKRGGLGPDEAVAAIESRPWRRMLMQLEAATSGQDIHRALSESSRDGTAYVGALQGCEVTDDDGEPTEQAFTLVDGYFDLAKAAEILAGGDTA